MFMLLRKGFTPSKVFELAKIYKPKTLPVKELPDEKEVLCLSVFGKDEDFFTLKGVIEGILSNFCYGKNVKYVRSDAKCMHPTRSADVFVDGVKIGYFGQIKPEIIGKKEIKIRVEAN